MIKRILALTLVCSFVYGWAKYADSRHVAKSVVQIFNMQDLSNGTGFVVEGESGIKYIVTNNHVCEPAGDNLVIVQGEKVLGRASPSLMDKQHDLCFIGVNENFPLRPLKVWDGKRTGYPRYLIGHPGGGPLKETRISYSRMQPNPACAFTTTCMVMGAEVFPGNSGSPVFNGAGTVVGIVNARDTINSPGNPVSYAVPASAIYRHLQDL